MRSAYNAVHVVVAREFIKFVRERSRLFSSLARPLLWLFLVGGGMSKLISPEIGVPYMRYIFPGILGMTVLFSSIFSSISIIWDKEFGFMKEMLAAPVPRAAIVTGKAISGTIVSTIQALIILMLFPFLGFELSILQITEAALICMLLAFCLSSLGILIAAFYENFESFSVIMNFIVMPMFFLSGAMYPVKMLPDYLAAVASINPLSYGIDALKHILLSDASALAHDFTLQVDLAVVVISSAAFVATAGWFFERRK